VVFTRDLNPETLRQMTDGYGRQRRRFQSLEPTEKKKNTNKNGCWVILIP